MAAAVAFVVTLVEMDDGRPAAIVELGDQALAIVDPGAAHSALTDGTAVHAGQRY
jgi:hypothetical protein